MRRALSFRTFLESASYCGLALSPLVAAIADASEGVRPALDDAACTRHFGCTADELPREMRRTIAVRAGGRGGKTSRLLAPKAVHAAWTVPAPMLRRREPLISALYAPDLKLARSALEMARGYAEGSPVLRRALVDDGSKDHFALKRPDGTVARVEVFAASRQGRGGRGKSLAFAGLDEAEFFLDEQTGVVNDADVYRAVLQRVVPGGQVWVVSTPWLADVGLLETMVAKNLGRHSHALAVTAGTRALNPTWDPTGEIERDMREQDPIAAAREIDAVPMAGGGGAFFDATVIRDAIDEAIALPLGRVEGATYTAGADWGFVENSSALTIIERRGDRLRVACVEEMRPTKGQPLRPSEVAARFAMVAASYGCTTIFADRHYAEAIREHLSPLGLGLEFVPEGADGKARAHIETRTALNDGRLALPDHPRLLGQLRSIVSRPTSGGGMQITAPRKLGAHGDVASSFVAAAWAASAAAEGPSYSALLPYFRGGLRSRFPDEDDAPGVYSTAYSHTTGTRI